MHDARIERAGDLAEGRRTEDSADARAAGRQARGARRLRDAGAEAVGQVEGLGTELDSVILVDAKLLGERQIEISRTPDRECCSCPQR